MMHIQWTLHMNIDNDIFRKISLAAKDTFCSTVHDKHKILLSMTETGCNTF